MKNTKKEDVKSSKNEKKKKIIGIIFGILFMISGFVFLILSFIKHD